MKFFKNANTFKMNEFHFFDKKFLFSLNLFRTREYYARNHFIILGIRPPKNREIQILKNEKTNLYRNDVCVCIHGICTRT